MKRMRFGKRAVTCVIDHFGAEGPEVFSQEIALMQNPRNPRKAFEMQSRILREAFRE